MLMRRNIKIILCLTDFHNDIYKSYLHGCAGLNGSSNDGILVGPGGPERPPVAPKPANGFG